MNTETNELELDEIQGNILAGFSKDHAVFLFLALPAEAIKAREWLGEIVGDVATTREVGAFNELFRSTRQRRNGREIVGATWMNLAFTYRGLEALGVDADELESLPAEFRAGMRCRAGLIGD